MGKQAYREGWSEFRPVRPHRTSSNHIDEAYRAGSSEFGVVRPKRTSWNHCDERGGRPTGKVRVSSGWFDYTEPLRTTDMKGEAGLLGRFKWVRGGSTTPNLLKTLSCRGCRTTGQFRVSFGWFDHIEPL